MKYDKRIYGAKDSIPKEGIYVYGHINGLTITEGFLRMRPGNEAICEIHYIRKGYYKNKNAIRGFTAKYNLGVISLNRDNVEIYEHPNNKYREDNENFINR